MKTFILILFLFYGHAGSQTGTEFSSLEKCEAAKALVINAWEAARWGNGSFAVCVEK